MAIGKEKIFGFDRFAERFADFRQIFLDGGPGEPTVGDKPFLIPFADDFDKTDFVINGRHFKIDQFGDADSGSIEQFQYRSIANSGRGSDIRLIDNASDFIDRQVIGMIAGNFRNAGKFERIFGDDFAAVEKLIEITEGGYFPGDRGRFLQPLRR